jgi:iron complex transport system substrate-binding protein
VDDRGDEVVVNVPVTRVVSLANGLTEIICALGCNDLIVGRDSYTIFPPSVLSSPVVAENSLNMELLLELKPDLVVADTRYSVETVQKIRDAGVAVIIDSPSKSERVKTIIQNFGLILDKDAKAVELVDYMEYYENLVQERLVNLTDVDKPLVYYEWTKAWYSCSNGSLPHQMLLDAGGLNVADGSSVLYPSLSAEFVVEQNPDIIVRVIGQYDGNVSAFQSMREEIMSRAGLSEVKAVQNGKVYVMDGVFRTGIRQPLGLLCLAKWFHPDLFADINLDAVHNDLVEKFFGVTLGGTYAYPEVVTIVDTTETPVTLNLPINRIACLNDGLTGVICALGCEDEIVGRPDAYEGYPRSILEKTNVGNSLTPNLEILFELKPDLVVVDSAIFYYGDETLNKIKDAGLTVIMEDSGTPSRLTTIISNFGQILNKTERATEILDTIDQYTSLITTRLENVTESGKPTFFLALMDYGWLTMANGSNANDRLVACGGINIAANSTVMYPELSAEYVVEANPDVIIVSAYGGSNLQTHEYARNQIMNNPVLSDVKAVKDGRVYTYNDCIATGVQYPAGWLYFAKWFHPDLFADIDPAAIHAELIRDFFGEEIEGVYAYP